jgi:hypothetical protein
MTTVANEAPTDWRIDVYAAAEGFLDDLAEFAETSPDPVVMAAALDDAGWTGMLAGDVLAYLCSGSSRRDLDAAAGRAKSITAPWEQLTGDDVPSAIADSARKLRSVLTEHADIGAGLPPRGGRRRTRPTNRTTWLVRDFLAARRINVPVGVSGSGKTTVWNDLIAASLTGAPFLGRQVPPLRWFVISGEQSEEEMFDNFDAAGLDDQHLDAVRWYSREDGVALGRPEWDAWLAREVENFAADVVVIDSATMVCTGVIVNDNDSVRALYGNVLRPIMDRSDVSVLLVHHQSESGRGGRKMLGASAWQTQADFAYTITALGRREDIEVSDGIDTRQRIVFNRSKTSRVVASQRPEYAEIVGHVNLDGLTDRKHVVVPVAEISTTDRIVAALDGPLGSGPLAEALELNRTGNKFRDALNAAHGAGLIVKNDDGLWERVA